MWQIVALEPVRRTGTLLRHQLFFRQDPDLMSAEDVLKLGPDVIIYQ